MAGELAIVNAEPGSQSITAIRKTAAAIVAQRDAIVQVMRDAMKKGVDYGTIPGTPKPTLYKPGSEKLLSMFRLAGKPIIEDLSTPDMIRYQVHFSISDGNGNFVGEGIGEASSAESKYQWRKAICVEEWESFPEDRRRIKWKKSQSGPYTEMQVRGDMEDIANTVLKMAKKRAQIDGVLTVTAASDVFSQDVEDLKELGIDPPAEEGVIDATDADANHPPELQKKAPDQQKPANNLFDAGHRPAQQAQSQKPAAGGRVVTEAQGRRFYAIARGHGHDNDAINAYLQSAFGVRKSDQIPADQYEEAIAWAEGGDKSEAPF